MKRHNRLITGITAMVTAVSILASSGVASVPALTPVTAEAASRVSSKARKEYTRIIKSPKKFVSNGSELKDFRYGLIKVSDRPDYALIIRGTYKNDPYVSQYDIFQYNRSDGRVIHPSDTLRDGAASVGGFRGDLTKAKNKKGLYLDYEYSPYDDDWVDYYWLSGSKLKSRTVWHGKIGDRIPKRYKGSFINFYKTGNLKPLSK